ncbi:sulfite exporter TauE/SafE family protein [Microbacterium sp. E-13]|uniref:sulfite exporter TauE/SafE family protein n=1 Tax=Microbacterium sp. E-13 TaxID=3404048 RepID=UPI003CEDD8C3
MSKRTRAENEPHRTVRFFLACAGIGLLAGILSGMFGVGGGTVIVPMLVLLLGFDQRRAAGTSLGAIVLTAPVGVVAYALNGSVDWLAGLILAAGAVVGAQIGTWLLPRVSQTALRWAFVAFLLGVIVSLFLVIPSRESVLELSWLSITGLVILGVVTGTVAGLIGVGGGIVVVPTLMLAFGMSDLTARGTSLLMMIPTALSGTAGNLRRQNVDLSAAATVGIASCATTALGVWVATLLPPQVANAFFAVFLGFIAIQMALRAVRGVRA